MGKVIEGHSMGLMAKWGIAIPRFVVADSVEGFDALTGENHWLSKARLVVKAHEAIGGRGLRGLVRICSDLRCARKAVEDILAYRQDGITIGQVIVEENIRHSRKREHYAALISRREGVELLLSASGGVYVESHWHRVQRILVPTGTKPERETLRGFALNAGIDAEAVDRVADFLVRLLEMFDNEDATYLEINPFVVTKRPARVVALDAVLELDESAKFRHPDWTFAFSSELGRQLSPAELSIRSIDEQVKGSVKFIELDGDTALLPAGGGASVFLADAVVRAGGRLANYAEYSGDPPDWAVKELTEKVCSLKGVKRIIIGGAIANFTDVRKTFSGIIQGLRKVREGGQLGDAVSIWVRRGGPNEEEALREIGRIGDEGFRIRVFDRKTALTDIVDMAFAEEMA